mmetsp:Transcript_6547/g.25310  ORF Transcript_6547/g.25310 Transcript_6547/m.25310 type:complete len:427 (+) Transcript_6547:140-1420(+)
MALWHFKLAIFFTFASISLRSCGSEVLSFDDAHKLDNLNDFENVDAKTKLLSACDASVKLEVDAKASAELWLEDALRAFRECGVVALRSAVPKSTLDSVREQILEEMRPLLESRRRIRKRLREAMASQRRLRSLWDAEMQSEAFFAAGSRLKERNDGRIDLTLGYREPFNATAYVVPRPVMQMLSVLLGGDAELKGMHAIYAQEWQPFMAFVPGENFGVQHWHRDTGLLFEPKGKRNTHDSAAAALLPQEGAHLPPYAINVFMPLEDVTQSSGPTEFTLGSHLWSSNWTEEEMVRERRGIPIVDKRFYLPAGTAILADYRTLHRGTKNENPTPRLLGMNIWGRDWWTDTVNYGKHDYGGFSAPLMGHEGESDAEKKALWQLRSQAGWQSAEDDAEQRMPMFWGLVNTWEDSLVAELRYSHAMKEEL